MKKSIFTFAFLLILASLTAEVGAETDKTILLMEEVDSVYAQRWFYSGSGKGLQKSSIREWWDKGYYITSAAYTGNGWFLSMSQDPRYTSQSYNYTQSWPTDWIKEKRAAGYYITSVSCSASRWLVVMSKVDGYTAQRYKQDTDDNLKTWYNMWRKEGYYLTQATFSGGQWLWVITKGTNIKTQGYKWATDSNVGSVIKNIWDDGKRVHFIEYADGYYLIPYGTYKDGTPSQSYAFNNSVGDYVSENWDQNRRIRHIGGANTMLASVASQPQTPAQDNNTNTSISNIDYTSYNSGLVQRAKNGEASAQYHLGLCYEMGRGVSRDSQKAVYWYRKAADQGYDMAQNNLGVYYEEKEDYQQAVYWYRKAAKQGCPEAQSNLGYCYKYGLGVSRDKQKAFSLYRKAAEQGLAEGQNNLAGCYEDKEDYQQAVYWYRKAAKQGSADGQYNLGRCYEYGMGVSRDRQQAVSWLRKAAEQGHEDAKDGLEMLGE